MLWSDHGWHLGEKEITGKNSLWEPATRVPLIFAGPNIPQLSEVKYPAELLDLYPTLIELCGLTPNPDLEGVSLMPQIQNRHAIRERPAITTHNPGNHSIRTEDWRLIVYADGSEELYDMGVDPDELVNRVQFSQYDRQREEMRQWLPKINAPHAPGSQHRVLWKEGDDWIWEGKKINPAERIR
ncbi:MAG: sulfatase-like hydrolase/transferase [Pirellulaceae bacterium]